MGCDGINEEKQLTMEQKMEILKRNLKSRKLDNELKIMSLEKEIANYENQIKDGENDIKLNQFTYNESELKTKVKKLIQLQNDKNRLQRNLDSLTAMNETIKNNIQNIENKMDEYSNMNCFKEGNELLNQLNKENNAGVLIENNNALLNQKREEERTKQILQKGNEKIAGNDLYNEDDYLKQLLGK